MSFFPTSALWIFGSLALISFAAFGIISWREGERRAPKVAFTASILSALPFFAATAFSDAIQWGLLGLTVLAGMIFTLLCFLPIGKLEPKIEIPHHRVDERDIMFARARLKPGTANYNAYYKMRPENKSIDDQISRKPGLLSLNAKYANPFLFASAEGSFFLTDALRDAVDGPVAAESQTLPTGEMTDYIKGLTKYFGALDVGITELKPYHVYSHIGRGTGKYGDPIPVNHRYAIAFTVEMNHIMIGANPTAPGIAESAKEYVESGRVAIQLAAAIRELGYPARAHFDGNYRIIAPLVARDAGLGELGRMGLLMTPKYGPRVRLGVVTTDLELITDEYVPDTAMLDFCMICKKCAENCPSRSIPFEPRKEIDGTLRWQINSETCFHYWNVIGTDCGICMSVCPYSHPNSPIHNLIRWGIARSGFFRRTALLMDDVFYGRKPLSRKMPDWVEKISS